MPALIDTSVMPGDDMSPALIEAAATNFRAVGSKVSARGGTVVDRWQQLAGVYDAPEDETLIQAMDPVKTRAEAFDKDLDTAAKALDTFADQVRTIKAEVVKIRADAAALLGGITDGKVTKTYYGGGDYYTEPFDWHTDQATVDANNALIRRTNDQQEALWAAERACATAIRAAVGLSPVRARDSANPKGYGSLEIRDDAPMPWGPTVDRTESCLEQAGEGVVFEGAGGVLSDLGALAGVSYSAGDGWDRSSETAKAAWTGLGTFAAGAATIGPLGLAAHNLPGPVGRFLRKAHLSVAAGVSGLAVVDLYAKDPLHKWKDDAPRAGGEVLFNAATFAVAPLKAGKLGRGRHDGSDLSTVKPSPPAGSVERVFVSADAHVADAASAIEKALPGRVGGVNTDRLMKDGQMREVDVDLGNIVVQVKGGKARNLTGQIYDTEVTTGVRTIGYAPDIPAGAWRAAAERGIMIARSEDELIAYLREFG